MRRGAESRVGAIDLQPGGASHHQPAVANRLVLTDSREDECGAGVVAGREAAKGKRDVEPGRAHADADEALRRPPTVAPQPARLAGRLEPVLAGGGTPGAGAVLTAPNLQQVGPLPGSMPIGQ